jgi:hypothetical protein
MEQMLDDPFSVFEVENEEEAPAQFSYFIAEFQWQHSGGIHGRHEEKILYID